MTIKKTSPVKTAKSSDRKIAAKKITKKSAASSSRKVSIKKTSTSKKAALIKKIVVKKTTVKKKIIIKKVVAPKKVATKITKTLLEKSVNIKKTSGKKVAKNISKANGKPELNVKKNANELLVDAAVEGILEVKGRDISILDLRNINNRVCDYYIICEADSSTQVNAIANSVEVMVKKRIGERPYHTEGFQNSEWILVDYVTVVVHVFQSQIREFYNLESLWADAEITKIAFN
jgi:ribosome-associated protein